MTHTVIPDEELAVFQYLDISGVVVDVGAREDIDMYKLRPDLEYHLFEPSTEFFEKLKEKTEGTPIKINNYGLAHEPFSRKYNIKQQSFLNYEGDGYDQELKTLDWYCKENGIEAIDFLKIDTEGYDYRVLAGAEDILENTKYIQFEYWDGLKKFYDALKVPFYMFLMMEPILREEVFRGFQNQEDIVTIFSETLIPVEDWVVEVVDKALIPGGFGGNVLCIKK